MKENKKEEKEQKVNEMFKILFEELTFSLINSGKGFFSKFENTLRKKTEFEDMLGILVSSHVSALNFWVGMFIDSSNDQNTKNKLKHIISSIEKALSELPNATVIKEYDD